MEMFMDKISDKQLREMKSRINEINSVMSKSGSTFRLIYAAEYFWPFFLFAGIFSVLFPSIYHLFIVLYGAYQQIPAIIKILFYAAIALSWIALIVIRTAISVRSAKRMDLRLSLPAIVKELLLSKIWIAVVPLIVCAVVIPTKYQFLSSPAHYIAYTGAILGLVLNIIGVMTNEKEYSFAGFWMIAFGLAVLLLFSMPGHIAFCVIFAPACFLFVLVARLSAHKRNTDESS